MSRSPVSIHTAREILAGDVLGSEEIVSVFGADEGSRAADAAIPFTTEELGHAKANGELLILRAAVCREVPVTLLWLIDRFPGAFNPAFLRKVGYQLKDEWGIELEPLAGQETPRAGWALVRKSVVEETRNLDYGEQDAVLARYAVGRSAQPRRRTAVEIAYDLIAFHRARGGHLLTAAWDWSRSRTEDGGYLNVGHFDDKGMQVFSYSEAVRHGRLGVCPTFDSPGAET